MEDLFECTTLNPVKKGKKGNKVFFSKRRTQDRRQKTHCVSASTTYFIIKKGLGLCLCVSTVFWWGDDDDGFATFFIECECMTGAWVTLLWTLIIDFLQHFHSLSILYAMHVFAFIHYTLLLPIYVLSFIYQF